DALRETLKAIYDLERLAGRVAFGNVNARDLIQLKQSLQKILELKNVLKQFPSQRITKIAADLVYPEHIVSLLESILVDHPHISIKEVNIIKVSNNVQLDSYRDTSPNGKKWIAELDQKEKDVTGIKSLKVGYNHVFGY